MDGSDLSHTESESFACGPTDHYHRQADLLERKKEKVKKKKLVGWLVVSIWMRLLSSACFPRSMRAPCSSPLWDLGLLHPSHLFFSVIGWIWCFSVDTAITYMFSSCSLPPSLSLHDDCVISFSLTHTNIYNSPSSNSFFQSPPHSLYPLRDQITRTSSTLSLSPQSFRISTFTPLFQLLRFFLFLLQKTQTTNHASTPFPQPGSTNPSTPTTVTAPSPLHNSKQ